MLLALIALVSTPVWPDTVPAFSLEFNQSQWEYACDHYWQDIYIPAQLSVDEYTYQCQFRIRGATSRELPKKSIKIELPQGAYLFGRNEFNMNAEYIDITRIRECLSYLYYSRTSQTVPEVHFTEVVFNGETQGAYLSVQDVDKEFLLNTDLPDEAVIYKCADRYTTLDRPYELAPYSKKTQESQPWDDFQLLIYWLRLCPEDLFREQLQQRFHYDDLISSVATNVLLGHGSTYYHNYIMLLDNTGSSEGWRYIPWDMDKTWGKYGPAVPYSKNGSTFGNRRNTLIWRMWCNETIREELLEEIYRQYPMYLEFSQNGTIDSLASLISPLVEADPFRNFTMDQFWGDVEYVRNWPESRYSNLVDQIENNPLPFSVSPPESCSAGIRVSWRSAGDQLTWRLEVSPDSIFTSPADRVYEAFPADTFWVIPEQFTGPDLWLQVYAVKDGVEYRSANGPLVSQAETQYETTGNIVINEINFQSAPQFNPGDWFEVINTEQTPVSLAGWALRDNNSSNLTTLGELVINPGQCMVFSSDSFAFSSVFETLPAPTWWLTFNLSDQGDRLVLADPSGNTVDSVSYLPDAPWFWQAAGNGSTLMLTDTSLPNQNPSSWIPGPLGGTPFSPEIWDPAWPARGAVSFALNGPLPVNGNLSIKLTTIAPVTADVSLFDLCGRQVMEHTVVELETGVTDLTLATDKLPDGIYIVVLRNMGFLQTAKVTILGAR